MIVNKTSKVLNNPIKITVLYNFIILHLL